MFTPHDQGLVRRVLDTTFGVHMLGAVATHHRSLDGSEFLGLWMVGLVHGTLALTHGTRIGVGRRSLRPVNEGHVDFEYLLCLGRCGLGAAESSLVI